jgi:hypothetical protein
MILGFFMCFLIAPAMLKAQPAPDAGGNQGGDQANRRNRGGGNNGGGGGNFDPAAMRQQFMDRIKEQMAAKDDEWKVIEPKLTKVMEASRATGRMGGFGRGGGGGGNNGQRGGGTDTAIGKARQTLQDALDNKDASADDIAKKLTEYRDARDKAKADLVAAQKDLKEILTQRQEAVLVMMGQLE